MRYKMRGGYCLKRRMPEDALQIAFAQWLDEQGIMYNASCAGMRTHIKIAVKMKAMGAKKGFPDIFIYETTRKYHGLALELKSKTGTPSEEQKQWRDCLNYKGYFAAIMPSGLDHDEGLAWLKKTVNDYLGIK